MNNIFYYYGIIFLFRCIRGIWFSDKSSKETFEMINSMSPLNNLNPEDKMKDVNYIVGKMKKKGFKVMFNILDIIWIVLGLSITIEWFPFLLFLLTFLISTYGVYFLKLANKIKWHYIVFNIIDIFICSYVLHTHLFS